MSANTQTKKPVLPIFGGPPGTFYDVHIWNPEFDRSAWGGKECWFMVPKETRDALRADRRAKLKRWEDHIKANGIKVRGFRSKREAEKAVLAAAKALPDIRFEVGEYCHL